MSVPITLVSGMVNAIPFPSFIVLNFKDVGVCFCCLKFDLWGKLLIYLLVCVCVCGVHMCMCVCMCVYV